jgi:hypothetical protein
MVRATTTTTTHVSSAKGRKLGNVDSSNVKLLIVPSAQAHTKAVHRYHPARLSPTSSRSSSNVSRSSKRDTDDIALYQYPRRALVTSTLAGQKPGMLYRLPTAIVRKYPNAKKANASGLAKIKPAPSAYNVKYPLPSAIKSRKPTPSILNAALHGRRIQ